MGIRKAKEVCPDLILVDGEDLSQYRQFSIRVSRLINGLTGGGGSSGKGVEKLGMDEVFLDCSELVYGHLVRLCPKPDIPQPLTKFRPGYDATAVQRQDRGHDIWFPLKTAASEAAASLSPGFWYELGTVSRHLHSESSADLSSTVSALVTGLDVDVAALELLGLSVASHLSAYLREQIAELIGLSSSAGIGHSKLISKLIGGQHKPNDQTTFSGSEQDLQAYLDPMPARKLNGFGSKIISKLEEYKGAKWAEQITVEQARTWLSLDDFVQVHGERLGHRLWDALHGIDNDSVHPTPDFPKTITVEDSYAIDMSRTYSVIRRQTQELVRHLLRRLQDELTFTDESTGTKRWIRFPTTFRMALRLGWNDPGGRDSKSARMPAFVFDMHRSIEDRSNMVMDKVAVSLLQDLLGRGKGSTISDHTVFEVYVINVGVANLSLEKPPPALADVWSDASVLKRKRVEEEVDWDVIESLPIKLRREVLKQYGLKEPPKATLPAEAEDDSDWNDGSDDGQANVIEDSGKIVCPTCKNAIFDFAYMAHKRWHGKS